MSTLTTNQGLILPATTDGDNVPGAFAAYNSRIENLLVMKFDSVTDRTARYPSPVEGDISYLRSTKLYYRYIAGAWTELIPDTATWTDYSSTFQWTSASVAPALGNATVVAEYRQPAGNGMLEVVIEITFGSTTSFGSGVYFFSLPVTAHSRFSSSVIAAGYAWYLDAGVKEGAGICKIETGGTKFRISSAPTTGGIADNWSNTVPFTWGNGDSIGMFLRYRYQ